MEIVDVNNKEVSEVKNKYKKLKNIILCIILIIVVIFVINLVHDVIILNKIFENNIEVDYGNNYKVIREQNNQITEFLYKDGRTKYVAGDHGQNIMMWDGDVAYLVIKDEKEYIEYTGDDIPMKHWGERNTVTTLSSIVIAKEDVDSLFDIIKEKIIFRMSVGTEMIDGKDYYVLETDADIKMWFSKEDYKLFKELNYGSVMKVDVIKDVVTDEDMKTPIELGYTKKEIVKTQSN